MPGFLIPLLVAGVILTLLGVLLWSGARERRQFSPKHDAEVGDLKLFGTYWETATPKLFGRQALIVSGIGAGTGPTRSQVSTLDFVKANAGELFRVAIAAAQKAVTATAADLHPDDLRVSGIFLLEMPNAFELLLDSESCAQAVPEGVAVSFAGKQIDKVELVH
jgi:hypothetical protein